MSNVHPSRAPSDWVAIQASTNVQHPEGSGTATETSGSSIATSGSTLHSLSIFSTGTSATLTLNKTDETAYATTAGQEIPIALNAAIPGPRSVEFGPFGITLPDGFAFDIDATDWAGLLSFDANPNANAARAGSKFAIIGGTTGVRAPSGGAGDVTAYDFSITDGTWDASERTLTSSGAFSSYTFEAGDVIQVASGTGVTTTGQIAIESKTSDNAIVLAESIAAGDLATGDITAAGPVNDNATYQGATIRAIVIINTNAAYQLDVLTGDGSTNFMDTFEVPSAANKRPPYTIDFGEFGVYAPTGVTFQASNAQLDGLLIYD